MSSNDNNNSKNTSDLTHFIGGDVVVSPNGFIALDVVVILSEELAQIYIFSIQRPLPYFKFRDYRKLCYESVCDCDAFVFGY